MLLVLLPALLPAPGSRLQVLSPQNVLAQHFQNVLAQHLLLLPELPELVPEFAGAQAFGPVRLTPETDLPARAFLGFDPGLYCVDLLSEPGL